MKTYKSGISLIVLVITVIVLAILATTVIISLSNTNIISQANNAKFKSDMANYKEMYSLYLADKLLDDTKFNSATLNVKYPSADFTEIFGNNVKEEYQANLEIIDGKLVYKTKDEDKVAVLQQLGMAITVTDVSQIKVGDAVAYIPETNPTTDYPGVTYECAEENWDSGFCLDSKEVATTYKPGNMEWVYLGQDSEKGEIYLTSKSVTDFEMHFATAEYWVSGITKIDELCNTLYKNSSIGATARNMKIEDVNRALGYVVTEYTYTIGSETKTTTTPMTIAEILTEEEIEIYERKQLQISTNCFRQKL